MFVAPLGFFFKLIKIVSMRYENFSRPRRARTKSVFKRKAATLLRIFDFIAITHRRVIFRDDICLVNTENRTERKNENIVETLSRQG